MKDENREDVNERKAVLLSYRKAEDARTAKVSSVNNIVETTILFSKCDG